MVQYLTAPVGQMRSGDYDTIHMVKALKGNDLGAKAYAWVSIDGQNVRITDETKDRALDWFAAWAAPKVDAISHRPKVLVPIPGSATLANSPADFRTALIARAIAARCQTVAVVAPVLRWRQAMVPSRQGGPRDPRLLYPHMVLSGDLPAGRVVLIDDVHTSGGHLVAAAWKLADEQRTAALAVCCGRSLQQQLADPFAVSEEELDIVRR